jgi:alanyl-tRNA synthetase
LTYFLSEKANIIADQLIQKAEVVNGLQFISQSIDEDVEMAKNIALQIKNKVKNFVVLLYGQQEGKAMICMMATDDVIELKKIDAAALIKSVF